MSEYFKSLILGQHFIELPKSTLPASVANTDGNYQFFCSSSEVKVTDSWIADKPTVLLGTGGVASVNYGEERFAYSTDTWAIKTASNDITIKYLYRLLQKNLALIDYKGFEGSGLKHLRKEFVKQLNVQVPTSPFVESKIINILDTIDETIKSTEALIKKYQHIKAGMMNDLFTRGVLPDGTLRPTRDQAPELYHETPIGWIPKEWGWKPISEICEFITSGSRGWAEYYNIDGALFIRIGNLTREHLNFRWDSIQRVKLPSYVEGERAKLKEEDILISITADLGIIGVFHSDFEEAYINQHIALVRLNHFIADARFTAHFLCTHNAQTLFQMKNDSGAKAGLNLSAIGNFLVPVPKDRLEAETISSRLDHLDKTIQSFKNETIKLKNQKSGLMHDLLTGQVRVKTAQE